MSFGLLNAAEMEIIRQDFLRMIYGPDGTNVVLHWMTESGTPDVYGRYPTQVAATLAVRAHVASHNVSNRPVTREKLEDVQEGDTVFIFDTTVVLTGKPQLWFEVAGLGNFVPMAKPPTAAHAHAVLFPSSRQFIQEVYAMVKR